MADADYYYNRGGDLHDQGKLKEAIAEYRESIRLKPDAADADAHFNLGNALKAQGKLEEAIAEFRKARDNAQHGTEFALLIERALADTDS